MLFSGLKLDRSNWSVSGVQVAPGTEDDDAVPNQLQSDTSRDRLPAPESPHRDPPPVGSRDPPHEGQADKLYARVNKLSPVFLSVGGW